MPHRAPTRRAWPSSSALALLAATTALAASLMAVTPARAQLFTPRNEALGLTTSWGYSFASVGGGVSWCDLNGDGLADLLVTSPGLQPRLFLASPGGGYALHAAGLSPDAGSSYGHYVADLDGDGDPDVLLLTSGRNQLLENRGDLAFVDVSATHLPGASVHSTGAAAGDLDGDGDLDVIVANYVANSAFPRNRCAVNAWLINDGHGRFVDQRAALVTGAPGCTLAVALSDVDDDGDLDVIEVNDFGTLGQRNRVWINNLTDGGGWRFVDESAARGLSRGRYGMGVAIADVDEDGLLDHFITSIGRPLLLAGTPSGVFDDRTDAWGASAATFGHDAYVSTWGAQIVDLDGDGFSDLVTIPGHIAGAGFLANDDAPDFLLFRGGPGGALTKQPATSLPKPDGGIGRGVALRDMDGDGDLDMAVALLQGDPVIYRNDASGQRPLRLTLRTSITGDAHGARVWATCDGVTRMREHALGGGSFGTGGLPLQFTFVGACAQAGMPVDLLVRWPSGYRQRATSATGAALVLVEPEWLALTADGITLAPTDGDGVLAALETLAVTADGADIGPLTQQGDRYVATLTPWAAASEIRVTIARDGLQLPAHPTLRVGPTWRLRPYPQRLVAGRQSRLLVDVDAASEAALSLTIGSAPPIPLAWSDGCFQADVAIALAAGSYQATLTVDGVAFGAPQMVVVAPPVDLARSPVAYAGLFGDTGPFLHASGEVRDVNGAPWDLLASDFALSVDGADHAPQQAEFSGGSFNVSFNTSAWPEGATLQLRWRGGPLGPPQTLLRAANVTPTDADPSLSWCVFARPSLRADGEDVSVLMVGLRDAGDTPIVSDLAVELEVEGLEVVDELTRQLAKYTEFTVRSAEGMGEATARPIFGGVPVGISCDIERVAGSPTPGFDDLGPETSLAATRDAIAIADDGPGETAIDLRPRLVSGSLVGSGLGVTWQTTLGVVDGEGYRGFGVYRATLYAGDEPGVASVTATTASGKSWTIAVTIEGAGGDATEADTVAGDVVDGPDTVDVSTGDAGDVIEASDTLEADAADVVEASDTVEADAADAVEPLDVVDTVSADTGGPEADTRPETTTDAGAAGPDAVAPDSGPQGDAGADGLPVADPGPVASPRVRGGCQGGPAFPWAPPALVVFGFIWLRLRRVRGAVRRRHGAR
jgi:hypothetical protein